MDPEFSALHVWRKYLQLSYLSTWNNLFYRYFQVNSGSRVIVTDQGAVCQLCCNRHAEDPPKLTYLGR